MLHPCPPRPLPLYSGGPRESIPKSPPAQHNKTFGKQDATPALASTGPPRPGSGSRKRFERAVELGGLSEGRHIGTHTFCNPYARRLLMTGVPINYLSRWLGHKSIQTTLIYLYIEMIPDPAGSLEKAP